MDNSALGALTAAECCSRSGLVQTACRRTRRPVSFEPSHSINCRGAERSPPISSIMAPSVKSSPAVATGHPIAADAATFSLRFMFDCTLSPVYPSPLNSGSIHITSKKKCRRRDPSRHHVLTLIGCLAYRPLRSEYLDYRRNPISSTQRGPCLAE